MSGISVGFGFYSGTKLDVKKSFNLTYKQRNIFERSFDAEDSSVINIEQNRIRMPENYFVTGEEVEYVYDNLLNSRIGINTTNIVGIGTTDKLPSSVYIIKLNELDIQVAASASDALSTIPIPLEINSLGIGTVHKFVSKQQNTKCLISIDNIIQSPVVSTSITTALNEKVDLFEGQIKVVGISSLFGGDLIRINDEIMRIIAVGIGSTNTLVVDRELLGSGLSTHAPGSLVTKISGNYNIVNNVIHFSEAPYGKVPLLNLSQRSDEVDYNGLEIKSSFSGRVFLRSGIPDTEEKTYSRNYTFDDISNQFTGYLDNFVLKSNQQNVTGFSTGNNITLINSILQLPFDDQKDSLLIDPNYTLEESAGITTISFLGDPNSNDYDINTSNLPRGGIIISIGSTKGFGYQPLVAAGGTAIVSTAGTIQSISIGNSGSGYRVGIQTIVNVGVQTESDGVPNIKYVGIASVLNGNIVGVSITNPGFGYTSTNPPIVIFDDPLSYSNIPLIYSNQSATGIGTGSRVNVVVGQGSSVISFELINSGFAYKRGEVLTVAIGGSTGIQTNSSLPFKEFQITVDEVKNDQFSSWSFGDLQVFDPIDNLFDGKRRSFQLKVNNQPKSILARRGSNIDVQSTLLVFLNDILQVPGEAYSFRGGSIITFKEAPQGPSDGVEGTGDTCNILFYRGTAEVDTINVDIPEPVEIGDTLRINSDNINLKQRSRTIEEIISTDIVETNLYFKEGIVDDDTLTRPVILCRQTEDKFINGEEITKDRTLYEPLIYPTTNIIKNINTNSDEIFVENLKTFFDNSSELNNLKDKILVISQDSVVSCSATAIVSTSGTISSISITNGGVGYTTNPTVTISNPTVGIGSLATATANVSSGKVNSINITKPGLGYTFTNPPLVLVESPVVKYEIINKVSYDGDFGLIVGVKTASIGIASTALVFDFYIPENSFLRDTNVNNVGIATTGISGIQTGYYFAVSNSNVGFGITSLDSSGNIIGINTNYIDGIYQAVSVSLASTQAPGIGTTTVVQVTVSVSDYNGLTGIGFSDFYGEYSWGRISNFVRSSPKTFESYKNGLIGISTSPIIRRFEPLKYLGYL